MPAPCADGGRVPAPEPKGGRVPVAGAEGGASAGADVAGTASAATGVAGGRCRARIPGHIVQTAGESYRCGRHRSATTTNPRTLKAIWQAPGPSLPLSATIFRNIPCPHGIQRSFSMGWSCPPCPGAGDGNCIARGMVSDHAGHAGPGHVDELEVSRRVTRLRAVDFLRVKSRRITRRDTPGQGGACDSSAVLLLFTGLASCKAFIAERRECPGAAGRYLIMAGRLDMHLVVVQGCSTGCCTTSPMQ